MRASERIAVLEAKLAASERDVPKLVSGMQRLQADLNASTTRVAVTEAQLAATRAALAYRRHQLLDMAADAQRGTDPLYSDYADTAREWAGYEDEQMAKWWVSLAGETTDGN